MMRYLFLTLAMISSTACSRRDHEGRSEDEGSGKQEAGERRILFYRHPMTPAITSPVPRKDEMGMDYVPVYADEHAGAEAPGEGVEGLARVRVEGRRRQLIGLKTAKAEVRPLVKTIRTVGRIAYDPELYRTQEEFLSALKAYRRSRASALPRSRERAKSLVASSRLRLQSLGLSDAQIKDLGAGGKPEIGLLIAPGRGGMLWLYADVYEGELALIGAGQEVEATSSSLPGETFRGEIAAVDRVLNPATRSARVRVKIKDARGLLRPGMYLRAVILIPLGERLAVPGEAVVDTGVRQIVFVDEGDGFLDPRKVLLGVRSEDYVEVLEGVSEGDPVVTSGSFLIDSESKLKAAISAIAGGAHRH